MNDEDLKTKNKRAENALLGAIDKLHFTVELANRCCADKRADLIAERMMMIYRKDFRCLFRRSHVEILADEYGLYLSRYADDRLVRLIGVRDWNDSRKIWEIDVDKVEHDAKIIEGGETLMSITGRKSNDVEQTAIKWLLRILRKRRRCSHSQRKQRKAKELQA